MSENWEKLNKMFQENNKQILEQISKMIGSGKTSEPPKTEAHKHFSEEEEICPDCYPVVKKKVLEKEILSRLDKPYECVNCGTRVDEDEEYCPTCHGTEARSRD